jgi:hypothetical protein
MLANSTLPRRAITATFRRVLAAATSSTAEPIQDQQQHQQQQQQCHLQQQQQQQQKRSIFTSTSIRSAPFTSSAPKSAGAATAADGGLSDDEYRKKLDDFQSLFVEARLCIEDAQDSLDTKYYDEDAEDAQLAVNLAITAFKDLSASLDEERQRSLMGGNGLKVEQLKGELTLLLDSAH